MDLIQVKDNPLCDPLAEAYPQPMCDGTTNTTFIRWFASLNGTPSGGHVDTTLDGQGYTVEDEAAVKYGECQCQPECCEPVCPEGVQTYWSDTCPEPPPMSQLACYQVCTDASTTDPVYFHLELYETDQAYPQIKNHTYTTGASTDGQYEVSIFNGRWTPLINIWQNPAYGDYALLPTPLLVFQQNATGLTAGVTAYAEFDTYEVSSLGRNAELKVEVVDTATGAVLTSGTVTSTKSWVEHRYSFTAPASGSVQFNIYSLRNGSASGNDVAIDDTIIAQVPVSCIVYRMVSENGVTTWYDEQLNVIPTPDLTGAVRIPCPPPVVETCYEKTTTTTTETYIHKEDYNVNQAYPYAVNQTYVSGPEGEGQYTIRLVSGRNSPAFNFAIDPAYADFAVLPQPKLFWSIPATGTPGTPSFAAADVIERAMARPAELLFEVVDESNGAVLATKNVTATGSWVRHDVYFTMPASGQVRFNIYHTRNGSASGNDPAVDDTKIGTPAGITTTEFYKKINTNGVVVWYDAAGNVVSAPDITGFTEVECPPPLVEKCYEVTTTTPGTAQAGANGSFVIDSTNTLPDQTCDLSMYGTAGGSDTFADPWVTEGTVMAIRDDNGACPNDISLLRLDAGDRIGVRLNLRAGVQYQMQTLFRNIDGSNGTGQLRTRAVFPSGAEVTYGPISTNRVGGNAGWEFVGFGATDSVFTADETGEYTLWYEGVAGAVRAGLMRIMVKDNSGEVIEPITTVTSYKQVTTNGVSVWYDESDNVISAPDISSAVEVTCQ